MKSKKPTIPTPPRPSPSPEESQVIDEEASEAEIFQSPEDLLEREDENETDGVLANDKLAADQSDTFGEMSVSGTMPDPEATEDTLTDVQSVGMQLDETTEKPEDIDIGRDVDKAEEYLRTH